MAAKNDTTALPVDIATMRETVNRLLDPDAVPQALPPASEELQTLTATMRGHVELLAPEVEQAARNLTPGSIFRYTVLGCVWEARSRVEAVPSSRTGGDLAYARRLARALNALCDHYERLSTSGETDQEAALRRLGEHSASCPTCLAVDEQGANLSLTCAEADRLDDALRKARSPWLAPTPRQTS